MTRVLMYLSVLAVLGGVTYLAGRSVAQTPQPAPAPKPATGKIAVFNVAKVMREYKKWQYFAGVMNSKRAAISGDLGKIRNEIATLQDQIQKEPSQIKKEELAKVLVGKQREFEDKDRMARKTLDEESAAHLQQLFQEIQAGVKAFVESNGYDVVFAYPDAVTPEEMKSPIYFDLKMRPPAAMPFYVSPSADITPMLIETLNKHFPPPAAAPVTLTGGTTVPTPGAPK